MLGDGLEARFINIEDALPDTVIAREGVEAFHRQALADEEPVPACTVTGEGWLAVATSTARRNNLRPCRRCFRALIEEAALDPDSEVALRDQEASSTPSVADSGIQLRDPPSFDPRLAASTEEVAVTSGGAMQAPVVIDAETSGIPTLCGREADRIVERRAVEPTYEECRECFATTD